MDIIDLNPRSIGEWGMPAHILVMTSITKATSYRFSDWTNNFELDVAHKDISGNDTISYVLSGTEQSDLLNFTDGIRVMQMSSYDDVLPQSYIPIPFTDIHGRLWAMHVDDLSKLANHWDACLDVAGRAVDDMDSNKREERARQWGGDKDSILLHQALMAGLRIGDGEWFALRLYFVLSNI